MDPIHLAMAAVRSGELSKAAEKALNEQEIGTNKTLLNELLHRYAAKKGSEEGKGRKRTNYVCFACSEIIYVWDRRRNVEVTRLSAAKQPVTCLGAAIKKQLLASGHSDGSVSLFTLLTEEQRFTQKAHKSSVTCVTFNSSSALFVSGSNDTEIVLWDAVEDSIVCRFKGHKSPITDLHFMEDRPYLLSSARDSLIRVWDLQNYRCCSVLVGHQAEICKFVLVNGDSRLITGSSDAELRVFDLDFTSDSDFKTAEVTENETSEVKGTGPFNWSYFGSVIRNGKQRITGMVVNPNKDLLAIHGNESILEVVHLNSEERIKELLDKRAKKERKRRKKTEGTEEATVEVEDNAEADEAPSRNDVMDVSFRKYPPMKLKGKIGSAVFLSLFKGNAQVLVNLADSIATLAVDLEKGILEDEAVSLPAHLKDIRTVDVTSDGSLVVSSSAEFVRIWNRNAAQCIHTLPVRYPVSSVLMDDDRHLILGDKEGNLLLIDIIDGQQLDSVPAHEGAVWGLSEFALNRSLVSGSEDKSVKLWDIEFAKHADGNQTKTLRCKKSLVMEEGVMAVKTSPDMRLIALSLLDNTVKIVFADTFKFFLSLYGHALPVTCLDISSDSRLIVTGSADKNIKIWGLDFGDCHKSLYAHDDSVSSVKFVPKTHLIFSAGRDGKVKHWDGDRFERIATLEGHHGAIWAMSISANGRTVVTSSQDRTIRLWQKTDEILVLDEERETEREAEAEKDLDTNEEPVISGEINKEIGIGGRRTLAALQAAEKLIEALQILREEKDNNEGPSKGPTHPVLVAMGNITGEQYLMEVLKRIKSSELQGALLAISLNDAVDLTRALEKLLFTNHHTELIMKCLTFLVRINALPIESSRLLLDELDHLRSEGKQKIRSIRDVIGFNLAALETLQRQIEERENVKLFQDVTAAYTEKKKKYKSRVIKNMVAQ